MTYPPAEDLLAHCETKVERDMVGALKDKGFPGRAPAVQVRGVDDPHGGSVRREGDVRRVGAARTAGGADVTGLLLAGIGAAVVALVVGMLRAVQDRRAVRRAFESDLFGRLIIANVAPPTRAEISVQPGMLRQSIVLEDVEPAKPSDGPVRALMSPYEYMPRERARGGPVMGGASFVLNGRGDEVATPRLGVVDQRKAERVRAESCGQTEPFLGRTPAEAAENLRVKLGHCPHGLAEEVTLRTGEVVAAVCPTCLDVLPASFVGSHWKP